MIRTLCLIALFAATAPMNLAQTRPFVRASGEGVVSFKPDQMKLTVSVITQADTAQQAADDNAVKSVTVQDAIRRLLGPNADIRTVSYSVSPIYKYPVGGTPVLAGYTATNSIEVTSGDLSIAGRLIDVSVQAGATTVGGIRFGLKDPQPARQTALKLATQQARASAEAIASGLNGRIGVVISVEEASAVRILTDERTTTGMATTTPIETGTVEVRANVVIQAELLT